MGKKDSILDNIARIAGAVYAKGWAEGGAGNISLLLGEDETNPIGAAAKAIYTVELKYAFPNLANRQALISTAGSRMRDLADNPVDNIVYFKIEEDGKTCYVLGPHAGNASSELPMHICILSALVSTGMPTAAIIHAHSTFCSILPQLFTKAEIPKLLYKSHTEFPIVFPAGVSVIEMLPPGSWKLAATAGKAAAKSDAIILTKHGTVVYDQTMDDAFDRLEVIEKAANLLWLLRSAKCEPDNSPWPKDFHA